MVSFHFEFFFSTEIPIFFKKRILVNDYFNALILGSSGKQLRQAVANLMYLCHTLLPKTSTIQDQVLQSLEVLHSLSQKEKFLEKITFGINTILEKNSEYIL